jgi:hypothetical protein
VKQYSIDTIELTWLGLDFKEGLAVGTSISEARNAPSWTNKPTGLGKVIRVYNPDRSGTVSVVVDQESQLHQSLKTIANTDRIPETRTQVADMVLRDTSSGEEITFVNSYIMTIPDRVRGTESQTFTWLFGYEDFKDAGIDPLANQVGN